MDVASIVDVVVYKGESPLLQWEVTDATCSSVGVKTVTPYDLTGALYVMKVKPKPSSPEVLKSWSSAEYELSITGTDNNVLQLSVGISDLDGLEPNTYHYYIQRFPTSGTDFVMVTGDFKILWP